MSPVSSTALALSMLLAVGDAAKAQLRCIGDCDADGAISIADLVVGVTALVNDRPPASCAAWDGDGDGRVTLYDLVGGVATAFAGACRDLPTTDPLIGAIDEAWKTVCASLQGPVYREDFVSDREINLRCELYPGHEVHLYLLGYAPGNAPYAFRYFSGANDFQDVDLGGVPARYAARLLRPPERVVRNRVLVWQFDCWVGRVLASDEPAYSLAPDPRPLSHAFIGAVGTELAARCDSFVASSLQR